MEDPGTLKKEMQRFRLAGYEIWMDDFGSGYSSLNVLSDFVFDEIKLDMLFMRNFDERSKQMIRSIVSMAKELDLQTLAEGVETKNNMISCVILAVRRFRDITIVHRYQLKKFKKCMIKMRM